jgi:hypothetical protein
MNATAVKIDIATFEFRTGAPPEYEPFRLSLEGKQIFDEDPKTGVIKLFNKLGFVLDGGENIEDELVGFIKDQPASFGQKCLLSILDNPLIKRLDNLIALSKNKPLIARHFTPDEELLDEAGTADTPPIATDTAEYIVTDPTSPKNANVTGNRTPVKPPYHRHEQTNIFDPIIQRVIIETINNSALLPQQKSYRAITKLLGIWGIKISHMTVKRRIEDMRQGKELAA